MANGLQLADPDQEDPLSALRTASEARRQLDEDPLAALRTASESFTTTPARVQPTSPSILQDFRRAGPAGVVRRIRGRGAEPEEEAAPPQVEGPPIITDEPGVLEIGEAPEERVRDPFRRRLVEAPGRRTLADAMTFAEQADVQPAETPQLPRELRSERERLALEEQEFQATLAAARGGVSSDQPITDQPLPEVPTLRETVSAVGGRVKTAAGDIARTFTGQRELSPGDVLVQADALDVEMVEPPRPGPRFRRPRNPEEMTAALQRATERDTEALQERFEKFPLPVRVAHSAVRGAFNAVSLGRVDELVDKANQLVAVSFGVDAPKLTTRDIFDRVERGLVEKGAGGAGFLLGAGGTIAATNRLVAGLAPFARSGTSARAMLESFDPNNPVSLGTRALQGAVEGVPFDLLFKADTPEERMFNVAAGLVIGAVLGPIFGGAVERAGATGAAGDLLAPPKEVSLAQRPIREVLEEEVARGASTEGRPGISARVEETPPPQTTADRRSQSRGTPGRRAADIGPPVVELTAGERFRGRLDPSRDIDPDLGIQSFSTWKRARPRLEADPDIELVFFDVRQFKAMNDFVSRDAGDKELRRIAQAMLAEAEAMGVSGRQVFRAGGDEFMIAVPVGDGAQVGRRVSEAVGTQSVPGTEFETSLRWGVGQTQDLADAAQGSAKARESQKRHRGRGGAKRPADMADPTISDVRTTRTPEQRLNPDVEIKEGPTPDGPAGDPKVRPRDVADPPPGDVPVGSQADGRGGFFDVGLVGRAGRATAGFLRRHFTSAGDLPDNIFRLKLKASQWASAQMGEMRFTLRRFDDALRESYGTLDPGDEAKSAIRNALTGKLPLEELPAPMQPVVKRMREQVDAFSSQFIESGMVRGELVPVIADNMGVYLTRSYRVFDDPNWVLQNVPEDVVNTAKAWLRSERPDLTDRQLQGLIEGILDKEVSSPLQFLTAGTLGSKDLSMLIRRKDIHPSIRALMGEHTDVRLNYARTVDTMTRTLANHEFLTQVARESTDATGRPGALFFRQREVQGNQKFITQIAASGSDVMSPLNGLYTTPEIAKAFETAFGHVPTEGYLGMYMKANGLVKFDKTVLSLMTHVRNVVGNIGFAVANGHWRLNHMGRAIQAVNASLGGTRAVRRAVSRVPGVEAQAPRAHTAAETARLERELRIGADRVGGSLLTPWERYYQKLQLLGVVDSSPHAGELADIVRDASRVGLRNVSPDENNLVKATRSLVGAVTDAYRAEDDLWKVVAFENEFGRYRRAMPQASEQEVEETAAWIVRNTYPTYSMVPTGVKAFRRNILVGSFTSFPAEVFRTLYHTMSIGLKEVRSPNPELRKIGAERLAGLAVAALGVHGASMTSRWLNGVSKKDDRDLRPFLAPWSRNSSLIYTSRAEDGNFRYIDLSYTDPYSYVRDPIRALLLGEDWQSKLLESTLQATSPFLSEEILFGKLSDFKRNTTPSGRQVFNPEDHILDQSVDVFNHFWDALEPGTITSAKRIARGISGQTSETGRAFDARTEALAVVTGHRLQQTDIRQSLSFRTRQMTRRIRDANRIMTSVGSRRGTVTTEEMTQAFLESERSREKVFEDAHRIAQAAIRLGMTDREVIQAFRDGGLSQADARAVVGGGSPPRRQLNSPFRERNALIRTLNQGR